MANIPVGQRKKFIVQWPTIVSWFNARNGTNIPTTGENPIGSAEISATDIKFYTPENKTSVQDGPAGNEYIVQPFATFNHTELAAMLSSKFAMTILATDITSKSGGKDSIEIYA